MSFERRIEGRPGVSRGGIDDGSERDRVGEKELRFQAAATARQAADCRDVGDLLDQPQPSPSELLRVRLRHIGAVETDPPRVARDQLADR